MTNKQRRLNKLIDLWAKSLLSSWRHGPCAEDALCLTDWRILLKHELGRPVYWPELKRAFATMAARGLVSTFRTDEPDIDGESDHIFVVAGPVLRSQINEAP